jgi:hypothetical protein
MSQDLRGIFDSDAGVNDRTGPGYAPGRTGKASRRASPAGVQRPDPTNIDPTNTGPTNPGACGHVPARTDGARRTLGSLPAIRQRHATDMQYPAAAHRGPRPTYGASIAEPCSNDMRAIRPTGGA